MQRGRQLAVTISALCAWHLAGRLFLGDEWQQPSALTWAPPTLPASPLQPPAAGRCTPTWPPSSAPPTFKLARRTALPSSSTTSGCSLPVRGRWPSSPPAGARRRLDACACTPAHVSRPASTQLFSSPGAAIGMIPVQLRATAGWLVSLLNQRPPAPALPCPACSQVRDRRQRQHQQLLHAWPRAAPAAHHRAPP